MVLNDTQLRALIEEGMIEGIESGQLRETNVVSSGISSFGVDARLGSTNYEIKDHSGISYSKEGICRIPIVDPKDFDKDTLAKTTMDVHQSDNGKYILVPPHGFVLGHTIEYFKIPRDVLVFCIGKSTYARCGLLVNTTPLEPEWEGQVTLELHNTTNLYIKVYVEEGICQFIYLKGEPCETSYRDRKGKYMGQRGVVFPRIKRA